MAESQKGKYRKMKGTGPLNALEITSAREVGACNSSCQLF